jgi:hypothetical protein
MNFSLRCEKGASGSHRNTWQACSSIFTLQISHPTRYTTELYEFIRVLDRTGEQLH